MGPSLDWGSTGDLDNTATAPGSPVAWRVTDKGPGGNFAHRGAAYSRNAGSTSLPSG